MKVRNGRSKVRIVKPDERSGSPSRRLRRRRRRRRRRSRRRRRLRLLRFLLSCASSSLLL